MTNPPNKTNPIGFHKTAFKKSPLIKAIIERVAPHEGHGTPVAFLNKQTGPTTFAHLLSSCMTSQAKPDRQNSMIRI